MGVFTTAVIAIGGVWYRRDPDGAVQQITSDVAQELIDAGTPIIESISEFFGEIGDQLSEGALDLIRGAGVAVLDATQATYTLASSIVAPRRVEAVAVGWAMLIYTLTAFTIYNKMKEN
ncbi:MAG: hypothetical protein GY920_14210 [Aliivibrio sp.]|nr:hypothetical protein [Aliivibrio sp.]